MEMVTHPRIDSGRSWRNDGRSVELVAAAGSSAGAKDARRIKHGNRVVVQIRIENVFMDGGPLAEKWGESDFGFKVAWFD